MNKRFIRYTIDWCQGEILEGRIVLLFGCLCTLVTLILWRTGTTPNAKALVIPLLVVSLLHVGTGLSMMRSNRARINAFSMAYQANPAQFVQQEKIRTESFMKWYPLTRYVVGGLFLIGMLVFLFTTAPLWKSVAICLLITGFSILLIDYFSEERATQYHQHIIETLS
ncbi:hypothetical protein CLV58_12448 [Spirosoma oryzae]|uniref:Uncharacterized protein n=1 Tax=Spirosoma oryzae TaxID=1469603 RepID=A0A2T0SAH7_9BACT|nr:hypothetical protein [Spirosoma oryzae]PRY30427.1 hypothetical protein CLV58_12448 [Spirosoma oryzae]